jgi:hypothetical protein
MSEYKCGHKTDGVIIMDGRSIVAMSEYLTWKEQNLDNNSMEKCFSCYLKELREKHGFKIPDVENLD